MRHCYLCDDNIAGAAFRRSVRTGQSRRLSVGRTISTSTTQRSGLRTLCGGCAARIDAEARLQAKIGGVLAVLFVGFVIYANVGSNNGGNHAAEMAGPSHATPGATTPVSDQPAVVAAPPPVPGESASPTDTLPTADKDQLKPASLPASVPRWTSAAAVRWRHTTPSGTRWSLRQLHGNTLALLVDLGDDQVATILIAGQFLKLDQPTIERQIDFVKSKATKISPRSAAYSFEADGAIQPDL